MKKTDSIDSQLVLRVVLAQLWLETKIYKLKHKFLNELFPFLSNDKTFWKPYKRFRPIHMLWIFPRNFENFELNLLSQTQTNKELCSQKLHINTSRDHKIFMWKSQAIPLTRLCLIWSLQETLRWNRNRLSTFNRCSDPSLLQSNTKQLFQSLWSKLQI